MPTTINVNGLSLCHKDSGGYSSADLPDVCLTPPGRDPVAYSNVATQDDLAKGTTSVTADGGHMCANDGSEFARSTGDEAGSDGGISSGTYLAEATWITYSFDVKLEGKGACRLTDKMLHNRANTGNLSGKVQDPLDDAIIQCILAMCEKDPDIVEKVGLLKIYSEEALEFKIVEYQEKPNPAGGDPIREWVTIKEDGRTLGWANRHTGEVAITRGQACEEIQRTMVHEVRHTEQDEPDDCLAEVDAFTKEEAWAILRKLPESKNNRRKTLPGEPGPDGKPGADTYAPDDNGIRRMVNRTYGCNLSTDGTPPKPRVRGRSGNIVWTSDGEFRPAEPGDKVMDFDPHQDPKRHDIPAEALQCPPPAPAPPAPAPAAPPPGSRGRPG